MLVWCSRAAARASRWNRSSSFGSRSPCGAQDLQGHAAAQRLLLGLVDDAHAAPADLADDPVVPQLLQRRGGAAGLLGGVTRLAHAGLVVLHQQQRREQRVDPLGPLGVALDVFGRRWALPAAVARHELLGQPLHRVTIVAGLIRGHGPYL